MPFTRRYKRFQRRRAPARTRRAPQPSGGHRRKPLTAYRNAKRINAISRTLRDNTVFRIMYHTTTGNLNTGPNVAEILNLNDATNMVQMWGQNNGTTNGLSTNKFTLHARSIDMHIQSSAQSYPVNFDVMIVRPTMQSTTRSTTGWTVNQDYYFGPEDSFHVNPNIWKILYRKKFDLAHFEYLSTTPGTNSNNNVRDTHKRVSIYKKWKRPYTYRKLDQTTSCWQVAHADLPRYMQETLMVGFSNTSAANSCTIDCTYKFYISLPS